MQWACERWTVGLPVRYPKRVAGCTGARFARNAAVARGGLRFAMDSRARTSRIARSVRGRLRGRRGVRVPCFAFAARRERQAYVRRARAPAAHGVDVAAGRRELERRARCRGRSRTRRQTARRTSGRSATAAPRIGGDPMANHHDTREELLALFSIKDLTEDEKKRIQPDVFLRNAFGPDTPGRHEPGQQGDRAAHSSARSSASRA